MQVGDRVELVGEPTHPDYRSRLDIKAGDRGVITELGQGLAGERYCYVRIDGTSQHSRGADVWERCLRVISSARAANGMIRRKWPVIASSSPVVDPDDYTNMNEMQTELATEPMYLVQERGDMEGLRVCVHPLGFNGGNEGTYGKPCARLIEGAFPHDGVELDRRILKKDCMEEWIRVVSDLISQARVDHFKTFTVMTAHGYGTRSDVGGLEEWLCPITIHADHPWDAAIQRLDILSSNYDRVYCRVTDHADDSVSYWRTARSQTGARSSADRVLETDHAHEYLTKLRIVR